MAYIKIYFYLKKSRIKGDTAPIYCRIQLRGQRRDFSVRKGIRTSLWDSKTKYPCKKTEEGKQLYDYLKGVEQSLFEAELQCIKQRAHYSIDKILDIHNGVESNFYGILALFDLHQKEFQELVKVGQRSQDSLRKYQNCLNHLQDFMKMKYRKSDMDVRSLNLDFIQSFDHYIRTVGKCSNNTTVKYLQALKKIVRKAILKGQIDRDPFMEYNAKLNEVDRDYLTDHELELIRETEMPRESLDLARDAFLLSCYTGLAYSDLKKLCKKQIVLEHGDLWIKTFRTKSKVKAEIMILPIAKQIIEKYKDHPAASLKETIIPMASNQKLNHHLKEIARLCGIEKHVVFHMARHTFATTVTLAKGVSIEVVSRMLGHKNVKQTQHYAKLVNTRILDEMQALKNIYK
jgi:site-specific recombinase XerD